MMSPADRTGSRGGRSIRSRNGQSNARSNRSRSPNGPSCPYGRGDPAPAPAAPETLHARLARPEELADWDARRRVPERPRLQSLAWGDYRAAHGRPCGTSCSTTASGCSSLVGSARSSGGGWAYRDPRPDPGGARRHDRGTGGGNRRATRGRGRATRSPWTVSRSPSGARAAPRSPSASRRSRRSRRRAHRMDVYLGPEDTPNSDEATIFGSFGADDPQQHPAGGAAGLRVKRLDAGGRPGRTRVRQPGHPRGARGHRPRGRGAHPANAPGLLRVLDTTAERRRFALASGTAFLDWSKRALPAGHMLYLQAEHDADGPVAGPGFTPRPSPDVFPRR